MSQDRCLTQPTCLCHEVVQQTTFADCCAMSSGLSSIKKGDCVGVEKQNSRHSLCDHHGLRRGGKQRGVAKPSECSSVREGKGETRLVRGRIPAGGKDDCGGGGVLPVGACEDVRIRRRWGEIRADQAPDQECTPEWCMAALDEARCRPGDKSSSGGQGGDEGRTPAQIARDDVTLPGLAECTEEEEAGGTAAPPPIDHHGALANMIAFMSARYDESDDEDCVSDAYNLSQSSSFFPSPARNIREKLDSFPAGTIDVRKMRVLAREAGHSTSFLDWLDDPEAIPRVLTAKVPVPGPNTDLRPSFVEQCVRAGVVKKMARSDTARGVVEIFTTPKRQRHIHRTIVNGKPVNHRMPKPPSFSLFSPPQLFEKLRHHKARWAAIVDMKGWFHQMPLCDKTASFFCFRREGTWYRWLRLPMGWSYAPYVAQKGSEALVGKLLDVGAAVYLDDIIIFGNTHAETLARVALLRGRTEFANAEINVEKSTLTPQQYVTYIGVQWCLVDNTFRFPEEWRRGKLRRVRVFNAGRTHSLQEVWQVLGVFFRVTHVMARPLCYFPAVLACMSTWARQIALGERSWTSTVDTPDELHVQIHEATNAALSTSAWFSLPVRPKRFRTVVWTDASTTGWGVIWQKWGEAYASEAWGTWRGVHDHTAIFALEAAAAAKGIAMAQGDDEGGVLLMVDNMGLAHCARKGHSRTRVGNFFLQQMYDVVNPFSLETRWIATDVMPADELSRRTQSAGYSQKAPLRSQHIRASGEGFVFSEVV